MPGAQIWSGDSSSVPSPLMCSVWLMALIMRDLRLGASQRRTSLICPAQGEGCNHLCGLRAPGSGRAPAKSAEQTRYKETHRSTYKSHVAPGEGGQIHAFVRGQLTKTFFWLLSITNPGLTGFLGLTGVCGFATGLDVAPGSFEKGFEDIPLSFRLCWWFSSPE